MYHILLPPPVQPGDGLLKVDMAVGVGKEYGGVSSEEINANTTSPDLTDQNVDLSSLEGVD